MTRKKNKLPPEFDDTRIIERPDGFYWTAKDGRQYGPFATIELAALDMEAFDDEEAVEPGESLHEAEQELGVSEWIDPDTGELAEDSGTRIEEH